MKNSFVLLVLLATTLALLCSHTYVYRKGLVEGEQQYKQSHRMYLALKSAYHFGYMDCDENRPEDWDNGGESDELICTDCTTFQTCPPSCE